MEISYKGKDSKMILTDKNILELISKSDKEYGFKPFLLLPVFKCANLGDIQA